ncbi:hypothetical protein ACJJTC_013604 [Scirpophaga incertulas]
MYHRVRRKMLHSVCAIFFIIHVSLALPKALDFPVTDSPLSTVIHDHYENNLINFDEEYSVKFNKKYGTIPWHSNDKVAKDIHRYTIIQDNFDNNKNISKDKTNFIENTTNSKFTDTTEETDISVIPLELISTTTNYLETIFESTTEEDLSVIPLSTTIKELPAIDVSPTVTLPTSTQETDVTTDAVETTNTYEAKTTSSYAVETTNSYDVETTTVILQKSSFAPNNININESVRIDTTGNVSSKFKRLDILDNINITSETDDNTTAKINTRHTLHNKPIHEILTTNTTKSVDNIKKFEDESIEIDDKYVPIFTELDEESEEVSEDYYDSKDVVPTTAPKTNALSVLVGLAGSVVESVAERVVPKGIYDLFKRMQKQNEALEAERLRSREENGGLGQFGRGILKSISTGLSKPLSQLMAGVRDIGSLDTDRGFINSLASGVTSVANSVVDVFKDRVQAIYPGTVWCGDGHSATARSGELGLFFFTDTCCRQHDACKLYIRSGETKYGLTNTGLFTRSHCSCDDRFRECLRRTSSLVSAQIGLTYFNVLGPQCFRKAHPIVKCVRRTRITGQKCEEYELDYTKPKMWQWFDNETF